MRQDWFYHRISSRQFLFCNVHDNFIFSVHLIKMLVLMEPEYKDIVWAVETAINSFMKKKKEKHSSKKSLYKCLLNLLT